LHDIILSFFILLFEQDDTDVVIQIFNSGLLESIGNVWVNRNCKLVEKKENLINQYDCYFGHVATLSNMILYYSIAKPTIALTERKEYKELIESNIDAYNLTHPRPLFQKEK
jgi:hypothetical protein